MRKKANTPESIEQIETIIKSIKERGYTLGRFKGIVRIAMSKVREIEQTQKSKEKN